MYKRIRALIASWLIRTPKRIRITLQDGTVLNFTLVENIAQDFYVLERSPLTEAMIEKERWRVRMKICPETAFMMFFAASRYTDLRAGQDLHVEVGMVTSGHWTSLGRLTQDNGVKSNKIASIKKA